MTKQKYKPNLKKHTEDDTLFNSDIVFLMLRNDMQLDKKIYPIILEAKEEAIAE
jgi:hypothetical protein